MSGDFIDSNVLLYLFADDAPAKKEAAKNIVQAAMFEGAAAISFQVVQEVLNGILRRAEPQAAAEAGRRFLQETLAPLWRVMPSEALYQRALDLHGRYRFSFYDSLIVAAALEA